MGYNSNVLFTGGPSGSRPRARYSPSRVRAQFILKADFVLGDESKLQIFAYLLVSLVLFRALPFRAAIHVLVWD